MLSMLSASGKATCARLSSRHLPSSATAPYLGTPGPLGCVYGGEYLLYMEGTEGLDRAATQSHLHDRYLDQSLIRRPALEVPIYLR